MQCSSTAASTALRLQAWCSASMRSVTASPVRRVDSRDLSRRQLSSSLVADRPCPMVCLSICQPKYSSPKTRLIIIRSQQSVALVTSDPKRCHHDRACIDEIANGRAFLVAYLCYAQSSELGQNAARKSAPSSSLKEAHSAQPSQVESCLPLSKSLNRQAPEPCHGLIAKAGLHLAHRALNSQRRSPDRLGCRGCLPSRSRTPTCAISAVPPYRKGSLPRTRRQIIGGPLFPRHGTCISEEEGPWAMEKLMSVRIFADLLCQRHNSVGAESAPRPPRW